MKHPIIAIELEFHPDVNTEVINEHRTRLYEAATLALTDDVVSTVKITNRWVPDE